MGMMWFIFSEVMFFAAFFGALFYARTLSVPWLARRGREDLHQVHPVAALRGRLADQWPRARSAAAPIRHLRGHSGLRPAGAQHRDPADLGRHDDDRAPCAARRQARRPDGLPGADLPAGLLVRRRSRRTSTARPTRELGLQLGTGIYGSTFFMLTGFHGLHVTIGAIMLTVIWLRVLRGPLHADAALRLRGRRLVLALRRRGLARPVRLRLLALSVLHAR